MNFALSEDFYPREQIIELKHFLNTNDELFIQSRYGKEFKDLNLIPNKMNDIVSTMLGRRATLIDSQSGIFRKPEHCHIHFEEFSTIKEWCMVVALEETTFNLMKHKSGCYSALQETNLDYNYFPEWDYYANILVRENQCIIYRPWLFHSIERGLVQYFKVIVD